MKEGAQPCEQLGVRESERSPESPRAPEACLFDSAYIPIASEQTAMESSPGWKA